MNKKRILVLAPTKPDWGRFCASLPNGKLSNVTRLFITATNDAIYQWFPISNNPDVLRGSSYDGYVCINCKESDMLDLINNVVRPATFKAYTSRQAANMEIVALLSEIIEENPELRMSQIIPDIDFYEESEDTLAALIKMCNILD